MITRDTIRDLDPSGMMETVRSFPHHIKDAVRIGMSASLAIRARGIRSIIVTGLGGSAISGDLLRCFLADMLPVPFIVNRAYGLPAFVDENSLVVVSSYSGDTEETVSAHREALRRKARVLAVTSGGAVASLARRAGHPCIVIPGGFHPRAALAYSFFPILAALIRLGLVRPMSGGIGETVTLLSGMSDRLADPLSSDNQALRLASTIRGTVPVIYSSAHLEAVNLRWRGQIAENAKQLAFGNVLPEMNHNEIVGWKALPEIERSLSVVFLSDRESHRRVVHRELFTQELLRERASSISVVQSIGRSRLARTFSLVHLGDWVSLYLAAMNGEDPSPVSVIDALKEKLRTV